VLFLFFSLSALQPSALFSEPLTIATYNVANYTMASRMVESIYRRSYPKTEKEKTALRAVIKALDADVLALQEMGTQPYLHELLRDLKTEGVDYSHTQLIEAADPDRHVAVLSRKPFTTVRKHTDLTFKYFDATERVKRGLLEVHIQTGAGDLALFIVHLKSRFTDRKDDPESVRRRVAEAQAVRDRVLLAYPKPAANPDARFVILGDFNDIRVNPPLQRLARRGRVEITQALRATDSHGEVWTHFYEKRDTYTCVDHILVSPALKKSVTDGAARIYDGPGVREASDHRPVYARLDLHP
jgi:endonuclease/exonuclease/phosphatase family metal-dependent hydrolase